MKRDTTKGMLPISGRSVSFFPSLKKCGLFLHVSPIEDY